MFVKRESPIFSYIQLSQLQLNSYEAIFTGPYVFSSIHVVNVLPFTVYAKSQFGLHAHNPFNTTQVRHPDHYRTILFEYVNICKYILAMMYI